MMNILDFTLSVSKLTLQGSWIAKIEICQILLNDFQLVKKMEGCSYERSSVVAVERGYQWEELCCYHLTLVGAM